MNDNINKVFMNNKDYNIVNINNLGNYDIDSFSLKEGETISTGNYTSKFLYNDYDNPFVIKKEFMDNVLCINPNYYINNQFEVDKVLCEYISNYKKENFSIESNGLIKNCIIDTIVKNKNIKKVSLCRFSKDGYSLSVSDYKKFKNANIRVDTRCVCDELKNNFDDIIICNSEKSLISYFKYRDLINKKALNMTKEFTQEELENLKYINPDMMIILQTDSFEQIKIVNDRLKELNKNNNIKIKIEDKNKFNEFIFSSGISDTNIYVETPDLENVSLSDYLKFEKILYEMVKNTKNLSPFEKYINAYNITKQFKDYKENEKDKKSSRKLYQVLVNEYMVCVGYSRLFGDLLDKMGITENKDLSVGVDESYDNVRNNETEFKEVIPVKKSGHARRYVHIVDPKYDIDGYYVADPTWDNDLEHDYYNHLAMTDNETTMGSRYVFMDNYMDLFNVNSIDTFIEKCNRIRKKGHYEDFVSNINRTVDVLKIIDVKTYDSLKSKYEFIDTYKWPDNITDFVYDLGNMIVNKTNKVISSDTIFNAVENVYRNSYGYSENEVKKIVEQVKEENIKRQNSQFPTRYRINQDGSTEVIINEENKFGGFTK